MIWDLRFGTSDFRPSKSNSSVPQSQIANQKSQYLKSEISNLLFLNGQFVPAEQARISVFDRGFLYGDGLFETLRVARGKPFRWRQHIERLGRGMEFLKLSCQFAFDELAGFAGELIRRNQMPEAVLRLTLSRGSGPRGYSIRGADGPTVAMSLHPVPAQPQAWRLVTSSVRLRADDPFAGFKSCNKLPQILARNEADAAQADEALLTNTDGWVVEGAASNLFWVEHGQVCTPPVTRGALPGITRAVVFELCQQAGIPCREADAKSEQLLRSEGVFLTLSSSGLVRASHLDEAPLAQSPIATRLLAEYQALLAM